jgi:hypothetical protein
MKTKNTFEILNCGTSENWVFILMASQFFCSSPKLVFFLTASSSHETNTAVLRVVICFVSARPWVRLLE